MQCPRCFNTDEKYFYYGSKGWYCRRCISFSRALIEEDQIPISLQKNMDDSEEYRLDYPLTKKQVSISKKVCANMFQTDILIEAVCGAGKTEIMVLPIAQCLKEKKKVCFAIARRQVVLELADRLQHYFPNAKVVGICGGHTSELDGDLIVCTTHQLYRFYQSFDLLILDEPDAYPYRGNEVLHGIAKTSCRGSIIFLTATPDDNLKQRILDRSLLHLKLNERPHHKPLPVPDIFIAPIAFLFLRLLLWLKAQENHPRMVFVPTIQNARILHLILKPFYKSSFITSQSENRDEIILRFKKRKNDILICTTVMERGITIPNVDICVFDATHSVFDEASLVQMAGRAGRNYKHPYGNVLFLCKEKSSLVQKCQNSILEANQSCIV